MTEYETLSIVVALIATVISLVVWFGQRKLQRESLDMQRATAELAKKQLDILVREDNEKSGARLKLDFEKSGQNYRFYITNIGNLDACNINMKLLLDNPKCNPIPKSELAKLPIPKLAPGNQIGFIASITLSSPLAYNALLSWQNPNGDVVTDETYVAL